MYGNFNKERWFKPMQGNFRTEEVVHTYVGKLVWERWFTPYYLYRETLVKER